METFAKNLEKARERLQEELKVALRQRRVFTASYACYSQNAKKEGLFLLWTLCCCP